MITYFVAAIFIIGSIITWIDWHSLFIKIWGNNPTKARVYVKCGGEKIPCPGKLQYTSNKGEFYEYRFNKIWLTVALKRDYPMIFIRGKREIHVKLGHLWADETTWPDNDENQSSARVLDAMIRGQVAVELVKSISGSGMPKLLTWIIIAALLAGAYFFYTNVLAPKPVETPPGQQQQQQKPPPDTETPYTLIIENVECA